jgi:peptidoglycan/LPS O-acetylase OafA/YrhL
MRAQSMPYFAALDGLRALSILLVIFYHAGDKTGWMAHLHGWVGVDIFFVLSGFLITYLLSLEASNTGSVDLGAFYARRAFRILPVYFVMLAVYLVATRFSGDAELWHLMKRDLPYFLTFCNEFAPNPIKYNAFGFSWSLGVEEKFYLVWPVLCFVVLSSLGWKRARTVALALLYIALVATAPLHFSAGRSYSGLLVGSLLALALNYPRAAGIFRWIRRAPVAVPLAFFGVGVCMIDVSRNYIFAFSWTVALLVAHLVTTESWLRSLLSHPTMTWLGKRSYGMYLIHMLPLGVLEKLIHLSAFYETLAVTTCTFVATALIADGIFRLIECPARDYGRRWLARSGSSTRDQDVPLELVPTTAA